MATGGDASVKPQKFSHRFVRALGLAVLEWLLICLLFLDAIFSYLITRFAHYCELQTPCPLCSRLDHVLGNERFKSYRDLICVNHKLEISSLVLCHAHNKLVDVRGMCENCLFSFAMVNKSNAETYRLLVGKVGEDTSFGSDEDLSHESHKNTQSSIRHCSCCNELWIVRESAQKLIPNRSNGSDAAEFDGPFFGAAEHNKNDRKIGEKRSLVFRAAQPRSNGQDPLSHVGYKELKIASDTESEYLASDDDDLSAQICEIDGQKGELAAPNVQLEPRFIIQSHDSAEEGLINAVSAPEHSLSVSHATEPDSGMSVACTGEVAHGLEELNWEQVDVKADPSALTNLISIGDGPSSRKAEKTSIDVANKKNLISVYDIALSSDPRNTFINLSTENELTHLDVPPSSKSKETSTDVSTQRKISSLDEFSIPSDAVESTIEVSEECKFVSFEDVPPPSSIDDGTSHDLSDGSIAFPVNDASSPSNSGKTSINISKENLFVCHDVLKKSESRESPIDVSEESKLISIDEVSLPPNAVESSVDISDECRLKYLNDALSSYGGDRPSDMSQDRKVSSLDDGLQPSDSWDSPPEAQEMSSVIRSELGETECEAVEAGSGPNTSNQTATGKDPASTAAASQASNLLDLSDAYKVAVSNRVGRQLSGIAEQWFGMDSSRLTEDLKLLLSQLSAARGFEQYVPDMSPKIRASREELKTSDTSSSNGIELLQKRISLERNESGFESLDGSTVSEIDGESVVDRLKRQIEHDRKLLSALYKELEEERSASAVSANQAMAMITKLQEEKASLHMEALQCLRMMEEQAEYDTEELQKTNDLLAEKEKEIQDLELELEYFRTKYPNDSMLESILQQDPVFKEKEIRMDHSEVTCVEGSASGHNNSMAKSCKTDVSSEDMKIADATNSALEFEDEKLFILENLKKLEKKLYMFSYNGLYSGLADGENSCDVDKINDLPNREGDSEKNIGTEGNELSMLNDAYESRGSPQCHGDENSELNCGEDISPVLKGSDFISFGNEISDLNERLEAVESDQNFLELTINSLKKGEEGVQFIQEIAYHLRELRRIYIRRREETGA